MRACVKCVLDERFPGISFDEAGVCNFCRASAPAAEEAQKCAEYEQKFRSLIEAHRGRSSYDALVAYSGGKDSTYTLYVLAERYGLSILAVTLDNWFLSEQAATNIRNVVKKTGADHISFRPRFSTYRDVVTVSAHEDLYSKKALQRSSAICTSCISLVRFICFQIAIEKDIPFVVFGMSPGQAPLATSIVKTNPMMVRQMQDTVYRPLQAHVGDGVRPYFLSEAHYADATRFPYSVNPLAFLPYDEEQILALIEGLGWRKPQDTDANSTNCLLNAYANRVHLERFGINPYAGEIAALVRRGVLSRDEGLRRLQEAGHKSMVAQISQVLEGSGK